MFWSTSRPRCSAPWKKPGAVEAPRISWHHRYCNPEDRLREHFPELHEFRIVPLGEANVLINRRRDGALEIRDDLVFHGGSGATLEMRC